MPRIRQKRQPSPALLVRAAPLSSTGKRPAKVPPAFRFQVLNGEEWEEAFPGWIEGDQRSYTAEALSAATTYTYRVFQYNGLISSEGSNVASATTPEEEDPDPELPDLDTDGDGVRDVEDPFPEDARRKENLPAVFHAILETEGYVDNQFAFALGEDLQIASASMPDSDSFRTIVWNADGSISSDYTVDRDEPTYGRLGGVLDTVSIHGKVLGYSDYGTWTAFRGEVSEFEPPAGFSSEGSVSAYPFAMSGTGVIFGQANRAEEPQNTFFLSPSSTLISYQEDLLDPREASLGAVFASNVIGAENYLWSLSGGFEALPGAAIGGVNDDRVAACWGDDNKWYLYADGQSREFQELLPEAFQQELRAIDELILTEVNAETNSPVVAFSAEHLEGEDDWVRRKFLWTRPGDSPQIMMIDNQEVADAIPGRAQLNSFGAVAARVGDKIKRAIPIQILNNPPALMGEPQPVNILHIATLEECWEGPFSTLRANAFDLEEDAFRVRITHTKGKGTIQAKISTENIAGYTDYNDDPTGFTLTERPVNSGIYESHKQMLVSNTNDDVYNNDPAGFTQDDMPEDHTHRIALGGKVILWFDPNDGEDYQRVEAATVPVEKVMRITTYVIRIDGVPVVAQNIVDDDMRLIRETWAAAGIQAQITPINEIEQASVPNLDLSDGFPYAENTLNPLTVEERSLFSYLFTSASRLPDEIAITYVNFIEGGLTDGQAYPYRFVEGPAGINGGNIILGAEDRKKMRAPHEIMHILLNARHPRLREDYRYEFNHPRMVWAPFHDPDTDAFDGRKRMTKRTQGGQARKAKLNRRYT
ncbi:MAG: hypothetical protein M3436_19970, partial [Pseudomonadota bacterium]|nr:hypothetical protein [Pseudomonadota bacterium]